MEKSTLTEDKAEQSPTGGVLVGKREGQTIIHNKGSLSGYLVGKTHAEGGIKAINKSTGQPLEMQGGEVVITAPAVSDQTKREFEGKMMTNREILSAINEKGGGVAFAKGGDIPKDIKRTGASYRYGGKTMTDHEIYKYIIGGHLAEDYSLREIASIHQVPLSDLKSQVRMGMKAESEHTSSKREQMLIVKDHLFENPEYYTLLKKAGLEDGGTFKDGGYVSYKDKYNKKYNYDKNTSHTLEQISKDTGVSMKGLQQIYNKGIGAYKTNPESVRPNVKSKEQWAMARVYSAVMGGKASKVDSNELKMNNGGSLVRDAKSGNTPARDLNNYNDVLDIDADGMVGAETSLYADGGIMANGGYVAPNGEPSNLKPKLYKLVRTREFKDWFGDWENDPKNSSKIVDRNGEPMIVYHGTKNDFYQFDTNKQLKGWLGRGFYFTKNKIEAKDYGNRLLKCFLNIRNPFVVEGDKVNADGTISWSVGREGEISKKYGYVDADDISKTLKHFKHDGIIEADMISCFNPTQIKLADETNINFDSSNPDIRYATGGDVKPYDANMEGDSAHLIKEKELSQEDINETIDTLEILYDSATRKEKQEIKQAIEVLKML
jgi:hypothetical protein